MSSTTTKTAEQTVRERIFRSMSQLSAVGTFLYRHLDLLVSLSEPVMAEKFSDDEDNMPYIGWYTSSTGIYITVYGPNQRETMRTMRRAIGGTWNKHAYSDTFSLSQSWKPHQDDTAPVVYVTISGERNEVCQKVVTGTKEVQHEAVEAKPARTETVEEVEWVCGNLLDD